MEEVREGGRGGEAGCEQTNQHCSDWEGAVCLLLHTHSARGLGKWGTGPVGGELTRSLCVCVLVNGPF